MFSERQWLARNPILWVVGAAVAGAVGAGGAATWRAGSTREMLYMVLAALGVGSLMSANLATRVEPRRLVVVYWPLWKRTIQLTSVRRAVEEPYDWWRYGGWGIRIGRGAVAYSVWGKSAVRLEMDGWDLVIGSRDAEGLMQALEAEGVRVERRPPGEP